MTILLDLGFLELDVLAHNRIILLERELLGLGAAVLARHIKEAGVGGGEQLDLDIRGFGHDLIPYVKASMSASA